MRRRLVLTVRTTQVLSRGWKAALMLASNPGDFGPGACNHLITARKMSEYDCTLFSLARCLAIMPLRSSRMGVLLLPPTL
jgi:hypothetical protein